MSSSADVAQSQKPVVTRRERPLILALRGSARLCAEPEDPALRLCAPLRARGAQSPAPRRNTNA